MQHITCFSLSVVDKNYLREFVEGLNGIWRETVTDRHGILSRGILSRGEAAIYCGVPFHPSRDFRPEELEVLATRMGGVPQTAINVTIGHSHGSRELAMMFVDRFIERWSGCFIEEDEDFGLELDSEDDAYS